MKFCLVVTDVVIMLLVPAESVMKPLTCDNNIIYDMTLSTEKQQCHMIDMYICVRSYPCIHEKYNLQVNCSI